MFRVIVRAQNRKQKNCFNRTKNTRKENGESKEKHNGWDDKEEKVFPFPIFHPPRGEMEKGSFSIIE